MNLNQSPGDHTSDGRRWKGRMGFNLKRFLRATPSSALRLYCQAEGIEVLEDPEWTGATKTKVDALADAIHALPIEQQTRIVTDFERVDRLCNPVGQRALFSVIPTDSPIRAVLQTAECSEARGLILLTRQGGLFQYAIWAAYTEGQRNGRSWSGFAIDSDAITGKEPPNWPAFKAHLAGILTRPDGTIGRLHVDSFERSDVGEDGKPTGTTVHHAIYSEALPVSEFEYKGDELTREIRRPAEPGAILYDADARTIDVMVGGGQTIRRQAADSFADNILGTKGRIHPVKRRHFDLERLRRPHAFATEPADGIKVVKLTLLRLARIGVPYERVTIEVDPSDAVDICTRSTRWFGDRNPLLWSEWQVTHAALRIVFYPDSGRTRETAISIELRRPNGSNLRDQTRRHQIISQKYLTKWGLTT
jgi:hypothetical protein